jgi:hypothetical protein
MSEPPPRRVWSGHRVFFDGEPTPGLVQRLTGLNLLQQDFEIHQYRGFTALTGLDRTDDDYAVSVKPGEFDRPGDQVGYDPPDGGQFTTMFECSLESRAAALDRFRQFVDDFHDRGGQQ